MKKSIKSVLFLSVAVLSVGACSSDKGPGAIGTKDDIVVVNKGIAGAKMPEPFTEDAANGPKIEGEDFAATVEQGESVPMEEVQETVPPESVAPAVVSEEAVVETLAPVPAPMTESTTVPQTAEPVTTPQESIYPAEDYSQTQAEVVAPAPAPAPATAPQSQPVMEQKPPVAVLPPTATPSNTPYPLDKNAPYSPKAVAAAAAGTPVTTPALSPSGINLNDPAIIRSVQAVLAAKTLYVGPQTGIMDANLMNSIVRYQTANKLAVGALNEETLKLMGIIE